MDKDRCGGLFSSLFSGLCVLAALAALLFTCAYCYPDAEQYVRNVLAGADDSPVRQAFSVMAEGLEAGQPVRDTMNDTIQVLFDQEN